MEEKRKAGLTMITEENGVFHIRTETDSYLFKINFFVACSI